jgi:hypothetical protein
MISMPAASTCPGLLGEAGRETMRALDQADVDGAAYEQDRKEAEVILTAWRKRFPPNMYAWPGASVDFAIEAVRALRGQ